MPRASRVPRLGRCLRRPRWAALALLFVTTSVLAQPPTGPIQRIYAPTSAGDPRAAGLEFGKAAEEPLREAPGIHAGGFMCTNRTPDRMRARRSGLRGGAAMERSVNTARNNRGSPAHPAISQRSHSRPARAFNTYLDLLNTYSNAVRRRRGFLSCAVGLATTEVL